MQLSSIALTENMNTVLAFLYKTKMWIHLYIEMNPHFKEYEKNGLAKENVDAFLCRDENVDSSLYIEESTF